MIKETFTNNFIEDICREFGIEGDFKYFETLTNGHINTSFKVYFYRDGEMKVCRESIPTSLKIRRR